MLLRVGRLGFEPGMTEPKPVVLPLHHRPIAWLAGAKVQKKVKNEKRKVKNFLPRFHI